MVSLAIPVEERISRIDFKDGFELFSLVILDFNSGLVSLNSLIKYRNEIYDANFASY